MRIEKKIRNMSYTFVKVQPKVSAEGKQAKAYWLFKPKDEMQIMEHWRKYVRSVISDGVKKLNKKMIMGYRGHFTNDFETAVEVWMNSMGEDLVSSMFRVENEALSSRISAFSSGHEIYLSHGMQVVILDERFTDVVAVKECDVLTFPDEVRPTLEDVRYLMWDGGRHTYAKIGKLDVVDVNGKMKWDTRAEAEAAAKWYIEKYW